MSAILLESIPESASIEHHSLTRRKNYSEKQFFEAAPGNRTFATRKVPRKMTESLSLARIGRTYGNDISKLNLMKPYVRRQSENEYREPWHSSSKTDTREYGDYYGWQTRLAYLEVNRVAIIASRGVKEFVNEYMKKLLRCEIFERGHKVELFATARYECLSKMNNASSSKSNVIQDSKDSFGLNKYRKNSRSSSIPVSALRTIEMIKKYRSGQPIDDLLTTSKEGNVHSGGNVSSSGTFTLKNPVQSQKTVSTSNIGSNNNTKISPKQNINSNANIATTVTDVSKPSSSTVQRPSAQKEEKNRKRKSSDGSNVIAGPSIQKQQKQKQNQARKSSDERNVAADSLVQKQQKKKARKSLSKNNITAGSSVQKVNLDEKNDYENRVSNDTSGSAIIYQSIIEKNENFVDTAVVNEHVENISSQSLQVISHNDFPSSHNFSENQNILTKQNATAAGDNAGKANSGRKFNIFGTKTKNRNSKRDSSVAKYSSTMEDEKNLSIHENTIQSSVTKEISTELSTTADESSVIAANSTNAGPSIDSAAHPPKHENIDQSVVNPGISTVRSTISDGSNVIAAKASNSGRRFNIFGSKTKNRNSEKSSRQLNKTESAASEISTTADGSSVIAAKASNSGRRFNIFGSSKNRNSEKSSRKLGKTESTASGSSTTKNDSVHYENTDEPNGTEHNMPDTSAIPAVESVAKNLMQNIKEEEERENVSMKSNFSTNRATLYRQYHPEQSEADKISVKSMQSVGSFDKDKFVESEKALHPRT